MRRTSPSNGTVDRAGLVVESLTVARGERELVSDASFRAPRGAVTALIGPNGAGKTSVIRSLTGATRPVSGTISLDGRSLLTMRRRERSQQVALVEQDATSTLPLDVASVVAMGRIPFQSTLAPLRSADDDIVHASMLDAGMERFAARDFDTLSGGERQRVHIARALAQQPNLLVLDEPTNHLDLKAQLDTLQLLRNRAKAGVAVVAALHDLNLVSAFCDRVVVMVAGRVIADGAVEDVLEPGLVWAVYGVRASMLTHPENGRPVLAYSSASGGDVPSSGPV